MIKLKRPLAFWSFFGMAAACTSPWLTACGGDDAGDGSTTGSSGGSGGSGGSSAGSGGSGGSAGATTSNNTTTTSSTTGGGEGGGAGSDACSEGDEGDLSVTISGLPDGVDAAATLSGPDGEEALAESATFDNTSSGEYSLSGEDVLDSDPLVRTLYSAGPEASVCLAGSAEEELTLAYSRVGVSNKLWVLSDDDAHVQAFASSSLEESNDNVADVALEVPAGTDLAFEPDGDLWVVGATVAEPHLLRYAAGSIGTSGEADPDREIVLEDLSCLPAIRALAFDEMGQLWVSACGDSVYRLTPEDLDRSGTKTASVVLSGVTENRDIAFDADGNLWVASDGAAVRYDADRLDASDSDAADAVLNVRNASDSQDISVDYLTFDADGNLWITDFGGNFVAQLSESDLSDGGERTVVAASSIVLSVSALLNRPAFDGEGGLWISYSSGEVARIAPADLLINTGAGDPTVPDVVLSGEGLGYTANVAFFPAPAGLPLYHALP